MKMVRCGFCSTAAAIVAQPFVNPGVGQLEAGNTKTFRGAYHGWAYRNTVNWRAFRTRSRRDSFVGRMLHGLRQEGNSSKILLKKVLLINNDGYIDNLAFVV